MTLLSVENLTVDYIGATTDTRAVDSVSFDIAEGEIFGLAGESGCGKSTIAYAICRLLKPPALASGGAIRFDGLDLLRATPAEVAALRWRQIAMVFQSAMNALNPVITVEAQFRDTLARSGLTGEAARARAEELMTLVDIPPERLSDYPHQFSGGMRQRIVIAIALALGPRLVIMDEPTTALDVIVQHEIMEKIAELQRRFGFSILFITHDLGLMAEYSDRMAVMLKGKIVEEGPAQRLYRAPQHAYTRALWAAFPRLPKAAPPPPDRPRIGEPANDSAAPPPGAPE